MKCRGAIKLGIKDCDNDAKWKCLGCSAQFDVPLETYHCDSCKEAIEKAVFNLSIMEYNRFIPKFELLECEG